MNTVIISGGSGFIGTHLARYLVGFGYEVYCIVKHVVPDKNISEKIHYILADLSECEDIISRLPKKSDAFFHFAWCGVSPDQRNDLDYQMQNVAIAENAVKLAAKLEAKKFIIPGSTLEYVYSGKTIDEFSVPAPNNAYGVAKIAVRYACSVLCRELKIPFIYTVISSIYSEDRTDNNVIYYVVEQLLLRKKPSLTNLNQLWDYVHIDDVVYGLRLIMEKGQPSAFYAIGHGDNCPLSEYIIQIRNVIDSQLPLGIGEVLLPEGILPCSCVSLDSIFKDTGYMPQVSFSDGIRRVIDRVSYKLEDK